MKSFSRVLRLSLRYSRTLVAAFTCSILVAMFWGANIATVYPFIEVVFDNRSLPDWVDSEIIDSGKAIDEIQVKIKSANLQLAGNPENKTDVQFALSKLEAALFAEQKALSWSQYLHDPIHAYLPAKAFPTLLLIVAVLLVGTLLKDIILVINVILVERIAQLTVFDLRRDLFRRTLRLDNATFDDDHSSNLLSRFTFDMECLAIGLNSLFGRALREPAKIIVCLAGAAFVSPRLLLVSLLVAPPAGFLLRLLAKSIKRANRRAMDEMSQHYGLLTESLGGMETIKSFTMEGFELERFNLSAKAYFHKTMRIVFYNSFAKPTTEFFGIGLVSLALVSGAYLVMYGQTHLFGIRICERPLSYTALMAFYAFLIGISDPARKMSEVYSQIQRASAASDRIYEMLDREPTIFDPPAPVAVPCPHSSITFKDVSFHYTPNESVLSGINLTIPHGQTLAIVGPNGCGKSTLANLIPRFYDTIDGTVSLDGTDVRQMGLKDLRGRIGVVTQQAHLFDDTVMNNIRYGNPEATDAEVIEASKKALADRFIEDRLDDGYETRVGQNGNRLSGGQRQRIALARAILRDPDILILDEATSQVDLESEQAIHDVLRRFVQDRTAIMITHRASTLSLADQILVMDAGQVIDLGTADELMSRCDLFRRLYDGQFRESA